MESHDAEYARAGGYGPPRSAEQTSRAEVTVTVSIGNDQQSFTAAANTTGGAANAANELTFAVAADAHRWINSRPRVADFDGAEHRRVTVHAAALAGGEHERVVLDAGTTGDVHEVAKSALESALTDLRCWTHKVKA